MLAVLRQRLTYANVMATIAVFIALGGSSYAALTLKKNSVKGKHIAPNAVTSPKVKNASLLSTDFAPGQLPRGEPGLQGPPGERGGQGEQGLKGDTGERGPEGPPNPNAVNAQNADQLDNLDSSEFLRSSGKAQDADKLDGVDSLGFTTGRARVVPIAFAQPPGETWWPVTSAQVANGRGPAVSVSYACPITLTNTGTVNLHNHSGAVLNVFTDNGGVNPVYDQLTADSNVPKPVATSASGEHVHFQVMGTGGVATVDVFSVHRASDCHWQVLYTGGG